MCQLNKYMKNQNGLTLIELLATIVILAIVSTFIFSILVKTLETNQNIQQETMLRDEADLIISKFIKTLYTTNQSHIVRNISNQYIEVTNDLSKCKKNDDGKWIITSECEKTLEPIGFKTENSTTYIHFKKEKYKVQNSNIKISENSKITGNPIVESIYTINLKLQIIKKRSGNDQTKTMEFKNQIEPIVSSK
ncbi:prepilin-type N-terminal cleavage/methylation domain-containing protein [Lysinibacillus sphaericus]|uniref:Prepilin-type N-terminal cleavage/methylation domain-containing protein n=1 Tax=Lysinibacillus sphaericus TaxID=1421 RepID=A0A544UXB0_LYSSH|nr:prepilin-type N-terminal cleavage/methylation domain-containing protein [Lysinibacillus sp. SDF0037]